jgi:hypothetical protein
MICHQECLAKQKVDLAPSVVNLRNDRLTMEEVRRMPIATLSIHVWGVGQLRRGEREGGGEKREEQERRVGERERGGRGGGRIFLVELA